MRYILFLLYSFFTVCGHDGSDCGDGRVFKPTP